MIDQSLLDLLLEPGGINIVFQPIIEFGKEDKRLHHFECLAHGPAGTNLENTQILFEYVRRKREELLVDLACIKTALQTASELSQIPAVSLNVHALTISRGEEFLTPLLKYCLLYNIAPHKIIVEIIEDHLPNSAHLQKCVFKLREVGFQIALDDFAVKNCNFLSVIQLNPDYLKLDRRLIKNCHASLQHQNVIKLMLEFSRQNNIKLVMKGVEEEAEFNSLQNLGANLMQGFFFSPPMPGEVLLETSFLQDCLN